MQDYYSYTDTKYIDYERTTQRVYEGNERDENRNHLISAHVPGLDRERATTSAGRWGPVLPSCADDDGAQSEDIARSVASAMHDVPSVPRPRASFRAPENLNTADISK